MSTTSPSKAEQKPATQHHKIDKAQVLPKSQGNDTTRAESLLDNSKISEVQSKKQETHQKQSKSMSQSTLTFEKITKPKIAEA